MATDGSIRFSTAIDTSGFVNGLSKVSSLAKQGATALAKLSLDGLSTSAEVAYTAVSKVALVRRSSTPVRCNPMLSHGGTLKERSLHKRPHICETLKLCVGNGVSPFCNFARQD